MVDRCRQCLNRVRRARLNLRAIPSYRFAVGYVPRMSFWHRFVKLLGRRTRFNMSPLCALCGRPAALVEIIETSESCFLRYSGPGGSNGTGDPISAQRASAVREALTPPYGPVKFKAAGFWDDAGFCAECCKFYCPTHWSVSSSGAGRCVQGHFKSLDPHWHPE